jgi:sugar phosphate isomerase/epimerase
MSQMTRRRFVGQCAVLTAAPMCPTWARAVANQSPSMKFSSLPRERVAVASYPFREFIAGSEHKAVNSVIELKDFPSHVVDRFHVHGIEPWSAHFPTIDPKYLEQLRVAVEKAHTKVVNIAVDGEASPYALDRGERNQAIAYSRQWIDVAVAIGSPSVRTNIPQAKDGTPDAERLAESLRRVVEYASAKNVVVHLENDNPVSEDPFFLVGVLERVNSPWLHALPDFGNSLSTHDEDYAYLAIDAMFAHAYGICHVKDGEIDARGKATHVDLPRTFGILKQHGFRGYCSIEYEGARDPYQATAELIQKTVEFLA